MSAFDTVDLRAFSSGGNLNWDDGGYQCEPTVEPEVGGVYRMQYAFRRRGYVTVLGIFDELIVVRYQHGKQDGAGHISFEEAVVRRNATFTLFAEMTAATNAHTSVE